MHERSDLGLRAQVERLARHYWVRGRPGRPTSQVELRWIYRVWLLAFALKVLGSSWDVSWHFKWLRDDLAPPHLLNSAGTGLVIAPFTPLWLVAVRVTASWSGTRPAPSHLASLSC